MSLGLGAVRYVEVLDTQIPAQGGNHGNPGTVHLPTPVTLKTQWNTYLHQYLP